jgi:hypothetical protein
MSQHKANPVAVLRAMLPELLPHGHAVAVGLVVEVVPTAGVLLYPAEAIRTNADGKVEILQRIEHAVVEEKGIDHGMVVARPTGEVKTLEVWEAPPEGVHHVHPIGQPLAPELCDAVIMFGTQVQDGMSGGLVTAAGQQARYRTSHVMHGELMRMPLLEWQRQHVAQLRGMVA